jgi:hypothetical protein
MKKKNCSAYFTKFDLKRKLEITIWFSSQVSYFDVVVLVMIVVADVPVMAHQICSSLSIICIVGGGGRGLSRGWLGLRLTRIV